MATIRIPPVLRRPSAASARSRPRGETSARSCARRRRAPRGRRRQLFGSDGDLNRYVNVYLNDEDVRVLDGLEHPVGERDTLVILPAMAGGA
jgi:molybdopterin converting factor small subunit